MIENLIAELDRRLIGPGRVKRRLLDDAEAGLIDAAAAYAAAAYAATGVDASGARRRAVTDFGAVQDVLPAYQTELDLARTRRAASLNLALVPLFTVFWNVGWELNPYPTWQAGSPAFLLAVTLSVLAWLTVLPAATVLLATSPFRWPDPSPRFQQRVRRGAHVGACAFLLASFLPPTIDLKTLLWPPTLLTVLAATTVGVALTITSGDGPSPRSSAIGRRQAQRGLPTDGPEMSFVRRQDVQVSESEADATKPLRLCRCHV